MRIFAIELSSRHGSVALVEDGVVAAERSWPEDFKNRQRLFDAIAALQVDWDAIDGFAVGRGPGAFSGMRISFAVANALARPGGKPVHALNSGLPLAVQVAAETGARRVAVVGDARREKVWAGVFAGETMEKEFQLLSRAELEEFLPQDALVASPDLDRLGNLLAEFKVCGSAPVFPSAGRLGELVCRRLAAGIATEPFEPLYMHPPVFIEPQFTG